MRPLTAEQSTSQLTVNTSRGAELPTADNSAGPYIYLTITRISAGPYIYLTITRSRPCLLYTSPSPRDGLLSRMPSSA